MQATPPTVRALMPSWCLPQRTEKQPMALGLPLNGLDHGAGGGQLLSQHAGVLGAGDGLEAVPGAGTSLTADAGNGAGGAAQLQTSW